MARATPQADPWIAAGAIVAALAVGAGAFGAHALRERLTPADLATFETAARYQMYHALALVLVGWLGATRGNRGVRIAGWLFLVGILLFSGSLYAMTLGGPRWLGGITPLGGVAFLSGWTVVAGIALRRRPPQGAQ